MLHGQQPVHHITLPRLTSIQSPTPTSTPGEDTPASPSTWTQHREQQIPVISHRSIDVEHGARGCSRRWEISWTAIARLKLGSSQPVRCCPATVCHPHWVHWDKGKPEKQAGTMAAGNHKRNYQKRPVLKLGCWTVRTMTTGLSASLQDIKDSRKTAVMNDELKRLNVDIATLHETRLADSGTLKEKDYTFFWQGKRSNEPKEHGVGFAVRNSLLRMVEPGSGDSERLLALRLNSTTGPVTVISVYAPTLSATPDTKDVFYENVASIIRNIPSKEQVVVLGDFNARVGEDHDSWPSCLGQFGVGKMNEHGQRLLELCTFHDLCITNSVHTKPQHKVSWRHPRSKHWHQLDLILIRRAAMAASQKTFSIESRHLEGDPKAVHCCATRMSVRET